MAGSSNFQQFNPNGTNMETDAQYSADSTRSGGAANPSIFPSATANKLFYQLSTFVSGLAQALANKGYALSDASLSNLAGVLANVMTAADMAPYAPLANPALTGTPTAPTQATADNSTRLATTGYVKAQGYAPVASPGFSGSPTVPTPSVGDSSALIPNTYWVKEQNYQPALGFTPVQQGGGAYQGPNKVYLGWDGGALRLQVDNADQGQIPMLSQFANSLGGSRSNGYQKFPNGLIVQWGWASIPGNGSALTFPITFPSQVFCIVSSDDHAGGSSPARVTSCSQISPAQFTCWGFDPASGTTQNTALQWVAFGH